MSRRRRRPFQFGLPALFAATALIGYVLAMPTWAKQMAGSLALGMAIGLVLITALDFLRRR
jgi:hypothetical protein